MCSDPLAVSGGVSIEKTSPRPLARSNLYYTLLVPPAQPLLLDAVKRGAGVSVHGGQSSEAAGPAGGRIRPPANGGNARKGEFTVERSLSVRECLPNAFGGPKWAETGGFINMGRVLAKAGAILAAAAGATLLTGGWASAGDPSGTQSFVLSTHSTAANPVYTAVATGVFSATGTAQATSTASNAPLKASFPGGTFEISQVTAGKQTGTINPSTCAAVYTDSGLKYKLGSGTGKYTGITGSGTANLKFTGTLPKLSNGKCNESTTATPIAGTAYSVVHASGPVTLP
jgi:hypothetical protein